MSLVDAFGMFSSGTLINTNVEAEIYYLYMMSDGDISYNEEKLFNEICKELSLEEEEITSVVDESKEKIEESKNALNAIIRNRLDEELNRFGLADASTLARIIWNLVNLGYADDSFSDCEKEIVDYLIKKWKIDKDVYDEMIDTADTMLSLTKQKEWVLSTYDRGKIRDEKERMLDSELKKLISDIQLTIKELSI